VSGICEKCGHDVEWHGPNGCDVEMRDYGEMDCGCTAYAFGKPAPVPARRPVEDALDRLAWVVEAMADEWPRRFPQSGETALRVAKAPDALATVRGEIERLRTDLKASEEWCEFHQRHWGETLGRADALRIENLGLRAEIERLTEELDEAERLYDEAEQRVTAMEKRAESAEAEVARLSSLLERIEEVARHAIRQGFLHQHEWVQVLNHADRALLAASPGSGDPSDGGGAK